jgi:tetratricopeptide (TPR) repeat protein
MAKIGRNDPCPCGSGKKYKRCCLARVEEAQRQTPAAAALEPDPNHLGLCDDCYDELAAASNGVLDLVDAGKLDAAEQAAHELLERFPDVHDGFDRLGMVYEARGDNRLAAEYYRKALAFVREHADDYDPEFENLYLKLIERVEPPADTG